MNAWLLCTVLLVKVAILYKALFVDILNEGEK